jgi:hypothetical protein
MDFFMLKAELVRVGIKHSEFYMPDDEDGFGKECLSITVPCTSATFFFHEKGELDVVAFNENYDEDELR